MFTRVFYLIAQFILVLCAPNLPIIAECTIEELLKNLDDYSQTHQMDAVLLLKNGRPLYEYHSNALTTHFDTMEIRNSILAIVVMQLIENGKINSLEDPISYYTNDCNTRLTIRHLLTGFFGTTQDDVAAALSSVIQKASGKSLETCCLENIFLPLGITDVCWRSTWDSAVSHLHLSCSDLAKVGTLILNRGIWNGCQVISERHLQTLLSSGQKENPFLGLQWQLELFDTACWWDGELLETYRHFGIDNNVVAKLEALGGRVLYCSGQCFGTYYLHFSPHDLTEAFGSQDNARAFLNDAHLKGLPIAKFQQGGVKSVCAIGQGGQQLLIQPKTGLVAVRQKRVLSTPCLDSLNRDFILLVDAIAQPPIYPIECP